MAVSSHSDKIAFFEKVFGQVDIFSKGNIQVKCPKCNEKYKKEGLNLRKRKLAINLGMGDVFHCWVCDYKGIFLKVLRDYFPQDIIKEYIHKFADSNSFSFIEKKQEKTFGLPDDYELIILNKEKYSKQYNYLVSRGVEERDFWFFKIGASSIKPWENRILFPGHDYNCDLNFISARAYWSTKYKYWNDGYKINSIVYNEYVIDWSKELTLVEGVFDLIKSNENTIPLLGSSLREDSKIFFNIIKNNTPILLALDKDMRYKKMPGILKRLMSYSIDVRILDLGEYNDVGEMSKDIFLEKKDKAKLCDDMSLLKNKIEQIGR